MPVPTVAMSLAEASMTSPYTAAQTHVRPTLAPVDDASFSSDVVVLAPQRPASMTPTGRLPPAAGSGYDDLPELPGRTEQRYHKHVWCALGRWLITGIDDGLRSPLPSRL